MKIIRHLNRGAALKSAFLALVPMTLYIVFKVLCGRHTTGTDKLANS